jgi:hypothetical protein
MKRMAFCFTLAISLIITALSPVNANSVTAKFLAIPYAANFNDFYYKGHTAFSIEFIGGEALKATDCINLTSTLAPDFSVKWAVGNRSLSQPLLQDRGFIHTIGVTKNGIQCAYAIERGLYSPSPERQEFLHYFSKNESKVDLKLTLFRGSKEIVSASGYLYNPDYAPPAPEIVGLNRGDMVSGYAKFTFKNSDGTKSILGEPSKMQLCELDLSFCDLGSFSKMQSDGAVHLIITGVKNVGKSAKLELQWYVKNAAGLQEVVTTSVIIQIGPSSDLIPWEVVSKVYDLRVLPNLKCDDKAISGKALNCSMAPVVGVTGWEKISILKTDINFDIFVQIDEKMWSKLKSIPTVSGDSTKFSISVPRSKYRFRVEVDNGVLPQPGSSRYTYGGLPAINLKFPDYVLWNKPFQISASSSKGNLTSCVFSMNGKELGTVKAVAGSAKISVKAVWSGFIGSSTRLYYTAKCIVDGKSVTGVDSVNGFR